MKRLLLPIAFCFYSITSFAVHYAGGEITYKQISALTFEVTVTTYTDGSHTSVDRDSINLCWGDGFCEFIPRDNGNGFYLVNDIKRNIYKSTHTYPGRSTYIVFLTDPNRIGGLLNVNPPNSHTIPFSIQTIINIQPVFFSGLNDSPIFLNNLIDFGYVGETYTHIPNHSDKEGDSIFYELIDFSNTPNYSMIGTIGAQPQSVTLDSITGKLVWDSPQVVGSYSVAILIKEYRNGALLSEITRDMTIWVRVLTNRPPIFTDTTLAYYEILYGQSFQFEIKSEDLDSNNVFLTATGRPMSLGATFVAPTTGTADSISGVFSWTPTHSDIRKQPYQMTFRAADDAENIIIGSVNYKVVRIKIIYPVQTKAISKSSSLQLYPNPASQQFFLTLEEPLPKNAQIQIFDNLGRLVKQTIFSKEQKSQVINTNDLSQGIYFLILKNHQIHFSKSFFISR